MKFSSTDSRTKSKHAMELGVYNFEGQLHNGRPYYIKRGTFSSGPGTILLKRCLFSIMVI